MTQPPNALLPGSGGSYRPPAIPPLYTGEVKPSYGRPVPPGPANNDPILSVAYPNTLTLTKPLLTKANLSGGRRIHLVVPVQRGGDWYLDTRPKPGAGNLIPKSGRAMLRVPPLHKYHFQLSKPTVERGERGALLGNSNTLAARLYFVLGEEVEGHPGYYRLTRLVNH